MSGRARGVPSWVGKHGLGVVVAQEPSDDPSIAHPHAVHPLRLLLTTTTTTTSTYTVSSGPSCLLGDAVRSYTLLAGLWRRKHVRPASQARRLAGSQAARLPHQAGVCMGAHGGAWEIPKRASARDGRRAQPPNEATWVPGVLSAWCLPSCLPSQSATHA